MEKKDANYVGRTESIDRCERAFCSRDICRVIHCPDCHAGFRTIETGDDWNQYLTKSGAARHPMVCDQCNRPLLPGDRAHAMSVFEYDEAYHAWEHEYLVLDPAQSLTR